MEDFEKRLKNELSRQNPAVTLQNSIKIGWLDKK